MSLLRVVMWVLPDDDRENEFNFNERFAYLKSSGNTNCGGSQIEQTNLRESQQIKSMSLLPSNYGSVVTALKERIRNARQRAVLSVNKELTLLYWEIGEMIITLQGTQGWGAKVIQQLSVDLRTEFPDFKGLSERNLKYMATFARRFPQFGQQPAAQIETNDSQVVIMRQQLAAQLPWGHLQVLMDKVTDETKVDFYLAKCVENGWSRAILNEQIKSSLYDRQGTAITNFNERLPHSQSDLAQQTLKNPYLFDFISLSDQARELDVERALIEHLKDFMLELGRGFAYVGRQKNINVQGDDFFLDLLFYNYIMHCFVVFELKVSDFRPEFAGKLNFYVNAINQQIKGPDDKPTIGVLLCKTPNETVVRYSLQGIESPIGVADYQLAKALPAQLTGEIPTVEELETEIDKEYEELKSPGEKKWDSIKKKLASLNQPKAEVHNA
ncbi:MAG: PDDEXK nuclease domain-containing protein [Cyclobacteriaceae bacterium]